MKRYSSILHRQHHSTPLHTRSFSISTPSKRPIYVAATRQHVGKTTTCLALISGLSKRFPHVGYIKPVGQRHVNVHSTILQKDIRVDKDVKLIREHFALHTVDYKDMSPVLIPSGYTRDFVDGKISQDEQLIRILEAVGNISRKHDVVLCEGTGHAGVGSIVGVSNAKVASLVGADMVLVVNGGLGSAFDELSLNRILCKNNNVKLAGVIMNKVIPDKYEQTKDYMTRALKDAWNVPLLGCIPDRPYLGCPALSDLEQLFQTRLMTGKVHSLRHYTIQDMNLVTTSLSRFLNNLQNKPTRTLYLCHITREDIILGFLDEYKRQTIETKSYPLFEAALIICGSSGKYTLSTNSKAGILAMEQESKNAHGVVPIMTCEYTMHEAMEMIHDFTPKLNASDKGRVNAAVQHYEGYIDFDLLLQQTGNSI